MVIHPSIKAGDVEQMKNTAFDAVVSGSPILTEMREKNGVIDSKKEK